MKATYRVLAFVICLLEVLVQAAAIAFAVYGILELGRGRRHAGQGRGRGPGQRRAAASGCTIHSVNGTMVIAVLAIVLLVVSFFAEIEGGVKWAGTVFAHWCCSQWVLRDRRARRPGSSALLHGLNALVLFGVGDDGHAERRRPRRPRRRTRRRRSEPDRPEYPRAPALHL